MKRIVLVTSTLILAGSIFLFCCSDNSKKDQTSQKPSDFKVATNATFVPPATNESIKPKLEHETTESGYKPNFIKAEDLLKKINTKEAVYIIDVRGQASYDEGHIKGSVSIPLPITEDKVKDLSKMTPIITYCGCPHHLSSIGAEQLSNLGYKSVHVLDEGFWYWKDHNYPLEIPKTSDSKISEITVAGTLVKDNKPLGNTDIYLKHQSSGQLEATKTDKDGNYKMHFHLYNYKNNDKFNFYVSDLKNAVQEFSTDKKDTINVIVNAK